jgi:hypothetical protein
VRNRRYFDRSFASSFDAYFARPKCAQREFQIAHLDVFNAATIGPWGAVENGDSPTERADTRYSPHFPQVIGPKWK